MTVHDAYKAELARTLRVSPDQLFLFWKGRVALFALLRAIGLKSSDEVVLPAFTCVAVPNAVMYADAIPRYVDIDPDTLTMDVAAIEAVLTPRRR